jgi:predicted HTH transcriptional regulator
LLSESPEDRPADAEAVLERLNEIRYTSNIDTLIASGEGDKIEFKASLHHPYESQPPDPRKPKPTRKEIEKILRKSVTKTIAAFLNSEGGTLLIGVADSGSVLGIEPDFEYLKQGKQNAVG